MPTTTNEAVEVRCPDCDAVLDPNPYFPGAYYDCAPCASDAMADAPVTLRSMRLEARS